MKESTLLQWLYIFELTAPVFYRVKGKFIKDEEEKKIFKHFEDVELPHSPMIKDFLRKKFNKGVFPFPFIIEWGAVVFSLLICLFGKKAMYTFEYLFEKKACSVYTKMVKRAEDDKELKDFAQLLLDEEIPHLEFFKGKLGKK